MRITNLKQLHRVKAASTGLYYFNHVLVAIGVILAAVLLAYTVMDWR